MNKLDLLTWAKTMQTLECCLLLPELCYIVLFPRGTQGTDTDDLFFHFIYPKPVRAKLVFVFVFCFLHRSVSDASASLIVAALETRHCNDKKVRVE